MKFSKLHQEKFRDYLSIIDNIENAVQICSQLKYGYNIHQYTASRERGFRFNNDFKIIKVCFIKSVMASNSIYSKGFSSQAIPYNEHDYRNSVTQII